MRNAKGKNMFFKKILLTFLAVLLAVSFFGCGEGSGKDTDTENAQSGADTSAPAEITYKVSVKDAFGNPVTEGVIVRFLASSEDKTELGMNVVGADGTVSKTMESGEYNVELAFTAGEGKYYYDESTCVLTPDSPETEILVASLISSDAPASAFNAYDTVKKADVTVEAYSVSTGGTYVQLVEGRNYFTFTPTLAGTYEISTTAPDAVIGYYGSRHYVQRENIAERKDNVITVSIQPSMIGSGDTGTTVLVIGVDADADTNDCILTVERVGDPEFSISEQPWQVYAPTAELSPYKLPEGAVIEEFDITSRDDISLVLNETDGFYHLGTADGPLVLAKLGVDSAYIDSIQTILDTSGINKYFFKENGDFDKKEEYSDCLLQYIANMDAESGYYPLTEDLMYIFMQRGDYVGWWDIDSHGYLFYGADGEKLTNINPDIAWLFLCSYIGE